MAAPAGVAGPARSPMTTVDAFHHVAALYERPEDIAAELAHEVAADLHAGAAVLVGASAPVTTALLARLGPLAARVHVTPAEVRYRRPVGAMDHVWSFARRRLSAGAAYVHSIGEIDFTREHLDGEWHWYESAVNEVLADLPLKGTCLYDGASLPSATIDGACATHPTLRVDGCERGSRRYDEARVPAPVMTERPVRAPDRRLVAASPHEARHAVRHAPGVPAELAERGALVISELVTNALLHGGGPAGVSIWVERDRLVVEVVDDGPGLDDPFATLRPPDLPRRGAGLWICHHESDRLDVRSGPDGGTTVTAVLRVDTTRALP